MENINENINENYVALNENEAAEIEKILSAIHMTGEMYFSMPIEARKGILSCAIETYKANLEKEKAVKKSRVQKSIHWASKTTTECKAIKAFIQGFKYLSGFVQNNASLLNEYNNEGENSSLTDIIDASIDKLLAENHSNFKKGSEKVKYTISDYESASLFITSLLKDKNSSLYKWLLQSKLATYEKMVYTTKDSNQRQQPKTATKDSKAN